MSIDKLVSLLEMEPRDYYAIKISCKENFEDYISALDAYFELLNTVKENPDKVEPVCNIIQELITNVQSLNDLVRTLKTKTPEKDKIDILIGKILKGEQVINYYIENFESVE